MKLELKHLAPYLPYKLGVASGDEYDNVLSNIGVMGTQYDIYAPNNYTIYQLCKCENGVFKYLGVRPIQVKPILRPLSSITKEEAYELGILLIGEADMEDKEVGIGDMTLIGNTYPVIMYQDQEDDKIL